MSILHIYKSILITTPQIGLSSSLMALILFVESIFGICQANILYHITKVLIKLIQTNTDSIE